jgi:hypothetical protein
LPQRDGAVRFSDRHDREPMVIGSTDGRLRMRTRATRKRATDLRRRTTSAARAAYSHRPPLGDTADPGLPPAQGLYDPALDKDACGVGFIADIKGRKSH